MDTTGKVVVSAIAFTLGAVLVWLVERQPAPATGIGPLPACELVPGTVATVVTQPQPLPAQIINPA